MNYSVAHFIYRFEEDWQKDLFLQSLADIGFDSFEDDKAYIPTDLYDEQQLSALVVGREDVQLSDVRQCEDRNWNEEWEKEHPEFEINLKSTATGRTANIHIIPRCAFGAGYHETTSMMLDALQTAHLNLLNSVLDNGCGTGILAIAAKKLGAENVVAVDIDTNSVNNTFNNAMYNRADITVIKGSNPLEGEYTLIMSNIHRNILMEQMPLYARYLTTDGQVWLSGFTHADIPSLVSVAAENGLRPIAENSIQTKGDWAMLKLEKTR